MRSFVRREGRLTVAQVRALNMLWDRYGVTAGDGPVGPAELFGREAPTYLEIGFGNGEALAEMAAQHPESNYIGIEVHRPGVGHLLLELEKRDIDNVRVYQADAIKVLQYNIVTHTLDGVLLFFPDPWPKQRHHKRRIVQDTFLDLMVRKLKPGGQLHLATDWENYAQQMLAVLSRRSDFINQTSSGGFSPRPDHRPQTKFERRGLGLGHRVWDLLFATRGADRHWTV